MAQLFRIEIQRVEYQRAVVEVEAESEEEAREICLPEADDYETVNADESIIRVTPINSKGD